MAQRARRYKPCGHTRAYASSAKKQESRRFILDCWQTFSGRARIPGQYWTLCGPDVLLDGSELTQLQNAGLFTATQFIGVEEKEDVYRANLQAIARLRPSMCPTLHHGDIIDVLHGYQARGRLTASIVNLDTASEARSAIPLLRRTLNVLNHIDGPTMVVWNVITGRHWPKNRGRPWDKTDDDTRGQVVGYISQCLMEDSRFRSAYRHGWDMFPDGDAVFTACRYDGAHTRSKTQMTMYVFVRRRRACGDDCRC